MLTFDDYLPSAPAVPRIMVAREVTALARVLADRLIGTLAFRLKDEWVTHTHVVFTSGPINEALLDVLPDSPLRHEIDWRQVHVWWTDEAFAVDGHPERNETRARAAHILRTGIPAANLHPMPAAQSLDDARADLAARDYSYALRRFAPHGRTSPVFDVLLLDVGTCGTTLAVSPGGNAPAGAAPVELLRDPQQPAKTRLVMTLPTIRTATRVWLLASGTECTDMVAAALTGADPSELPLAAVKGVIETSWWLDEAAARALPAQLRYGDMQVEPTNRAD